jgi:P-type E1-E2 ATPase
LQEGKAEKAAEAIKAMLSSNAVVVRDGERKQIPAEDLVPGDIVVIKSGDKIPADVRLIQTANLQVQEAMLTGESVPASKHLAAAAAEASLGDRKCMCYSATAVVSGQAQGVVVATGDSAEIGLINRMVGTVGGLRAGAGGLNESCWQLVQVVRNEPMLPSAVSQADYHCSYTTPG